MFVFLLYAVAICVAAAVVRVAVTFGEHARHRTEAGAAPLPDRCASFRVHHGALIATAVHGEATLDLVIDRPGAPVVIRMSRPTRTSSWADKILDGAVIDRFDNYRHGATIHLLLPDNTTVSIGCAELRWGADGGEFHVRS